MKTILRIFVLVLSVVALQGCQNETYAEPTEECVSPSLVKNKEVSDIYTLATALPLNSTARYTSDDVIEAIVTSSDEGGNFFKTISLMSLDGTRGFSMAIDDYNLYTKKFQPGKKVYIKMKDLYFSLPDAFARGLTLGAIPTSVQNVDRIPTTEYAKYIIPTCTVINEDTYVKQITLPLAVTVTNDALINTLVEVNNVQFQAECATYSKKDFDTSLKINNGISNVSIDVRTSRFANFAGNTVQNGNGKIRGILTKYANAYQLILRTERDVKLTNPRVGIPPPVVPLGGTAIVYSGSFLENFASYTAPATQAVIPKYININTRGQKYWSLATFSGTKYLQMSAYNADCSNAVFIVPVNMTAANTFSFKSKDGYFDEQPLKIYYSMDYVPGGNFNQATLVDITSSFNLANGLPTTANSYATNFTPSGNYIIPSNLTGNGYFIFEYNSSNGATTTMQITDITVN
jgi:Family of unknown function (DUF5689)